MTSRQPPPGRKRVGVTRALTRDEEAQQRILEMFPYMLPSEAVGKFQRAVEVIAACVVFNVYTF